MKCKRALFCFHQFFFFLILISFFFLCNDYSSPLFAEEMVLSLRDAYASAIKNHEAIKIAEEGLYQLEQGRKKALSNVLPTLSADAGYTRYATDKSSAVTVIQPDYSYNYNIRLGIPIYRGGKEWSALRQAKYLLETGEKRLFITRENIIMEVSNAYYSVLKVMREIEIKEADLKRAQERSRVASARFKVGELTKAAVLRTEAEVAGIQADLTRVRKDLLVAQDRLARLVGSDTGFKLVEPLQKSLPSEGIEELIKTAFEKRDDYLNSKAEEEIAKENIKYAKGGYMPTLRLDGVYSWRDQDPISSAFFNKESISATATLSFPLYEGGLRLAEVREAESKLRETELTSLNLKKEITIEVREAFYNLEAISSAMEFYRKQVSFAEENYNTVFKQFTYGIATNVDVIDANSTLVAAQESLANSTIDQQVAILDLKRRIGVLLNEIEGGNEIQH